MENVAPKSSIRVQIGSLIEFAEGLGYVAQDTKDGVTFVNKIGMCKQYPSIGVHSMQLLHNFAHFFLNNDSEFVTIEVGVKKFELPWYFVNRAVNSKMVESVNLRLDKKDYEWVTDKEWVKFVNGSQPLVEGLLGIDIYLR